MMIMIFSKIRLVFLPEHIFIIKYKYENRDMENDYGI